MIWQSCLFIHSIRNKVLDLGYCQIHCIGIPICTSVFYKKRTYHSNHICKNIAVSLLRPVGEAPCLVPLMVIEKLRHGISSLFILFIPGHLVKIYQGHTTYQIIHIVNFTAASDPPVIVLLKTVNDNQRFL